jgi:hypothetical protein
MTNPAPSDDRPLSPEVDDIWVDPDGELFYWDGTGWLPYADPPEWPGEDPAPLILRKDA